MKRDDDLVRTVLLLIEERGLGPNSEIQNFDVAGQDARKLNYHVWLLFDGGYIHTIRTRGFDAAGEAYDLFVPCCLTFRGQEFLNSVRDSEVWRQTREAAQRSGAASLDLLGKLAVSFLKKQIKERTGVELE